MPKGPDYTWFPDVCPFWDNSARRPLGEAILFRNTSPRLFGDWISAMTPALEDENFIAIDAWNEWAEGYHLESFLRHGHNWLDTLRASLGNSVAPEVTIR